MGVLAVSLFGSFQASLDGRPLAKFRTSKVQALLAYLAVESAGAQRREALMELLWPGLPPKSAGENLRQTLYLLRRAIPAVSARLHPRAPPSDDAPSTSLRAAQAASSGEGEQLPFLLVDRRSVQINPAGAFDLDVTTFVGLLAVQPTPSQLAQAVALYRGDFLSDFYLPDSADFEAWASTRRAEYRRLALGALDRLATWQLDRHDYDAARAYAERQLAIDNLREGACRQLMIALASDGRRTEALAEYETRRRLLREELGIDPAPETRSLYDAIRSGAFEIETPRAADASPVTLPAFLSTSRPEEVAAPLFVARERELAHLSVQLAAALAGEARVAFVVGEAGNGKTALLTEFARRAQAAHVDLIVAGGNCNAFAGVGDPYLPFRDVLGMLCGDVEPKWAAGVVAHDQARRLWGLMPDALQALAEEGPDLIDVFVSGPAWLRRASVGLAGQPALKTLKELVERKKAQPVDLQRSQLFEEYTNVLRALAARRPLLLMLDDLQWADEASISLLFHLGRRLTGNPILILGAYRLSDVALGRPGAGLSKDRVHPLRPVVSELARSFGDIQVDLSRATPAEGREFVDALLDTEPNRLDEVFRAAVLDRTKGHPLFTVELLRAMRARGDLVRDGQGRWVQGAALDWGALPARVEAVIEQRIDRLDGELRDILAVASVEGEMFTAEVVARVQKVDEHGVLRALSRELGQRHGLVHERGEVTTGLIRLSRFQFSHVLFQQYVYHRLSPGERRLLHGDVARTLEALYAESLDDVLAALAHHYAEAGEGEQAIDYLLRAGDRARTLYAHQEAIDHYRRALRFLKELGEDERAARTLMKLGLAYSIAFDFDRARQTYAEGFALWQRVEAAQSTPRPSSAPNTLRLFWLDPAPHDLDPTLGGINLTAPLTLQLFSGLVTNSQELEVIPDVARRWEILDDGRKYVFHLREDAYWSDGRPVTAHDFEFTFKRALDPATQAPCAGLLLYSLKGARDFHQGRASDPKHVGVYALDDYTLVCELEEPATYFIQELTYYVLLPVPRHVVETYGAVWTEPEHIVTNGPFTLAAWRRGESLHLERNPHYHGRFTGNVQQVKLVLGTSVAAQLDLYAADELDGVSSWFMAAHDLDRLRQRYAGEYHQRPLFGVIYLIFDVTRPPFDDARLRRAFVMAIDRETLANVIGKGYELPATGGLVPPGMPGHSAGIGLSCAAEQARLLLAHAGYPAGHDFPRVDFVTYPTRRWVAEFIQTQWRDQLGVEARLTVKDMQARFEEREGTQPLISIAGWTADYADPDNFLRVDVQMEAPHWRNGAYENLMEQARLITDQAERVRLYQQADRILMDEAVIAPLTYTPRHLLLKPWVKKYPIPAIKNPGFWKDVVIEREDERGADGSSTAGVHHVGKVEASTSLPPAPHPLRMVWGDPSSLDPTLGGWNFTAPIAIQLFSGLVAHSPEMEVIPDVARSWDILDGGQTYVFHLRDDVYWSDGTRVTAADFEFTFKRALDPATKAPVAGLLLYSIRGARDFHQGNVSVSDQVGVRALDEVTLRIDLEEPSSYFIQDLSYYVLLPVPRHVVEQYGRAWAEAAHFVTNGPFRLAAWQRGESMLLERNPRYHGRFSGNVDQVRLALNVSVADYFDLYEADQLDVVYNWSFSGSEMDSLRARHAGEYVCRPRFQTYYIYLNVTQPPFDDVRVRRAFALAIDKQHLAEVVDRGYHLPASGGFVPPGMPGHSPGIGLPYDPERARQLLAEAGYPAGRNFPEPIFRAAPTWRPLTDYLLAQWRDNLRVESQLKIIGPGVDVMLARQTAWIARGGWWADYADPDNFLRVDVQLDAPQWRHPDYERLLDQARRITDQAERVRLYQQADRILMDEAVVVPLVYMQSHLLLKPWVRRFPTAAIKSPGFWKDVIIEPH